MELSNCNLGCTFDPFTISPSKAASGLSIGSSIGFSISSTSFLSSNGTTFTKFYASSLWSSIWFELIFEKLTSTFYINYWRCSICSNFSRSKPTCSCNLLIYYFVTDSFWTELIYFLAENLPWFTESFSDRSFTDPPREWIIKLRDFFSLWLSFYFFLRIFT